MNRLGRTVQGIRSALEYACELHGQDVGAAVFADLGQPELAGEPYCGAFVRDVFRRGGIDMPADWIWVDNIRAWGERRGLLRSGIGGARPGDLALHGRAGLAHVGIVVAAEGGAVRTVAGNVASHGGRVAVQTLSDYWQWHVTMAGVIAGEAAVALD
jgi:cell wall-associated NlpC family hydrolase